MLQSSTSTFSYCTSHALSPDAKHSHCERLIDMGKILRSVGEVSFYISLVFPCLGCSAEIVCFMSFMLD